jgi:hypothetical protein
MRSRSVPDNNKVKSISMAGKFMLE